MLGYHLLVFLKLFAGEDGLHVGVFVVGYCLFFVAFIGAGLHVIRMVVVAGVEEVYFIHSSFLFGCQAQAFFHALGLFGSAFFWAAMLLVLRQCGGGYCQQQ